MIFKSIRWFACLVFVLLALGASLVGDYVTAASGTLLALFLTFSKQEIEQKTQRSYRVLLTLLVLLFLVSSMWGAANSAL